MIDSVLIKKIHMNCPPCDEIHEYQKTSQGDIIPFRLAKDIRGFS